MYEVTYFIERVYNISIYLGVQHYTWLSKKCRIAITLGMYYYVFVIINGKNDTSRMVEVYIQIRTATEVFILEKKKLV